MIVYYFEVNCRDALGFNKYFKVYETNFERMERKMKYYREILIHLALEGVIEDEYGISQIKEEWRNSYATD